MGIKPTIRGISTGEQHGVDLSEWKLLLPLFLLFPLPSSFPLGSLWPSLPIHEKSSCSHTSKTQ